MHGTTVGKKERLRTVFVKSVPTLIQFVANSAVGDQCDNELVGLSGDAFELLFGRCLVRISSGPPTIVTGLS